jgi:truncated hemoglobin YjbI
MTSLYAHAGGEEAVHRLEKLFYSKVLADPLLGQGPLLFEGSRPNTSSSTSSERWRHPASCISATRYVERDRSGF